MSLEKPNNIYPDLDSLGDPTTHNSLPYGPLQIMNEAQQPSSARNVKSCVSTFGHSVEIDPPPTYHSHTNYPPPALEIKYPRSAHHPPSAPHNNTQSPNMKHPPYPSSNTQAGLSYYSLNIPPPQSYPAVNTPTPQRQQGFQQPPVTVQVAKSPQLNKIVLKKKKAERPTVYAVTQKRSNSCDDCCSAFDCFCKGLGITILVIFLLPFVILASPFIIAFLVLISPLLLCALCSTDSNNCNACDCGNCSGCDCGNCDCNGCDCGSCNCNGCDCKC